jgi:hypothetical protein
LRGSTVNIANDTGGGDLLILSKHVKTKPVK